MALWRRKMFQTLTLPPVLLVLFVLFVLYPPTSYLPSILSIGPLLALVITSPFGDRTHLKGDLSYMLGWTYFVWTVAVVGSLCAAFYEVTQGVASELLEVTLSEQNGRPWLLRLHEASMFAWALMLPASIYYLVSVRWAAFQQDPREPEQGKTAASTG